jgi:predicted lipoprotein with Yx(FWY)xxD motif
MGVPVLAVAAGLAVGTAPAGASLDKGVSTSHTLTLRSAKVANLGTVLTTSGGLTLYRFTADTSGHATCTGACAKVWPPLLVPKGDHLKGPHGLKGWSTINLGHGHKQASLGGVALYRFSGDTKKGQDKGQGVESTWFAMLANGSSADVTTPGAAPAPTTAPAAATTTTTGHATTPTTAKKSTPAVVPAPTPTSSPTTQPAPAPTPTTTPTTQAPTPTTQPPATTTTTSPPSGGYGY